MANGKFNINSEPAAKKSNSRRVKGEGSIFRRQSDGKWVVKYNGQVKYAKSSLEARDKLNEMKVQSKKPDVILIKDAVKSYLNMKRTSIKPTSLDRLESTFECLILPTMRDMPIESVTYDYFYNNILLSMKNKGLAYSSVNYPETKDFGASTEA